jgi:hypothetical protein
MDKAKSKKAAPGKSPKKHVKNGGKLAAAPDKGKPAKEASYPNRETKPGAGYARK